MLSYTRPASKIITPNRGSWGLGNRTPEACTNLSCVGSFFVENGEGIEALAEPIFVRGYASSMAGGPCRPRSSSKIIASNRGTGVFRNELRKCIRTSHGRFVYCGNGEGIEALAKPIFVRGVSPFYGWHAPCLAGAPCAWLEKVAVGFGFTSVCGPGRKLRRAPFPLPSRGRGRALLSPLRSARRGRFSTGSCRLLPPRLFCRCTPLCC